MGELLDRVAAKCERALMKMERLFKADVRLTLLARTPGNRICPRARPRRNTRVGRPWSSMG
jgi:hypothetical protein